MKDYEEMIHIPSAKERFMGNYKMFSMYLYQFAEGALVGSLENALEAGDIDAGFEIAHDLKGVILNLLLRTLEMPIGEIVEALRGGKLPDEGQKKAFEDAYQRAVEQIGRMKEEGVELF